jgi:hypothetical protein
VTEAKARAPRIGEDLIHSAAISDVNIYGQNKSDSSAASGIQVPANTSKPLFADIRLQEFFNSVKEDRLGEANEQTAESRHDADYDRALLGFIDVSDEIRA